MIISDIKRIFLHKKNHSLNFTKWLTAHILVETEDGAGMIEHDWVIITVCIYT